GRGLIAGCEKVFHLEHALWRGHVFPGYSAAHSGLVHAHGISNFSHYHGLQVRRAVLKEIALPRNDLLRDVENCLLALMDRADQEFSAPDFVPDIIFNFAALGVAGRDDVLIKITDPQMRDLLIVQGDLIFAIHLFDDHIGQHIVLRRSSEDLTWTRIQPGNVVRGFLNVLNANAHPARDLRKTSP